MMKHKMFTKISRFSGGTPHRHSKKGAESVNNDPKTEEFERCVMCGALTSVPVATHIDFREEEYEVGCGQLCNACRLKLREETQTGWSLSNAQILRAVEQSRTDTKKDS